MNFESRPFLLVAFILACSAPAYAVTWVVDQDGLASGTSCDAAIPAFLTITAAVTVALGGDTILVCPGSAPYNEQLSITNALTIRGFTNTNVVIRPSPMLANATSAFSGSPIAAAIVVADTTATLTNLVVDGAGGEVGGAACSGPNMVGIFFRNASGTVSNSTVRNMRLVSGLEGCQFGLGIFAQSGGGGTSTVTIDGVNVHSYQKNGIVANEVGTTIDVTNSLVTGEPAANVSVQNGIQVGFGATGSIEGTQIVDQIYLPCTYPYTPGSGCDTGASLGILVFDADVDVLVQNNAITNTQGGIFIGGRIISNGSHRTEISGNVISDTRVFQGIIIIGDDHTVSRNSITRTDGVGIFVSGTANRVNTNRLQEAPAGVWVYSGSNNTVNMTGPRANVFYNIETPTILPAALSAATRSTTTSSSHRGRTRAMPPQSKAQRY